MIDIRISFPLNIFRTNKHNLTKLCIQIYIFKSSLGLLHVIFFCKFNRITALDRFQNFVFAQTLETELIEFGQILHMHRY